MIQQKQVLKYATLDSKIIQIYVIHLISYLTILKFYIHSDKITPVNLNNGHPYVFMYHFNICTIIQNIFIWICREK